LVHENIGGAGRNGAANLWQGQIFPSRLNIRRRQPRGISGVELGHVRIAETLHCRGGNPFHCVIQVTANQGQADKIAIGEEIVHAAEVMFGPDREMGFSFMALPCVLGHLERKFDGDQLRAINKEIEQIEPDAFAHMLDTVSKDDGVKSAVWVVHEFSRVRNPHLVVEVVELILLDIPGIQFEADELNVRLDAAKHHSVFAFARPDIYKGLVADQTKVEFYFAIELGAGEGHKWRFCQRSRQSRKNSAQLIRSVSASPCLIESGAEARKGSGSQCTRLDPVVVPIFSSLM